MTKQVVIAIDGPSGAGKGTVARRLASVFKCQHIDTGAMYRAVAWWAIHDGYSLDDDVALANIAKNAHFDFVEAKVTINGYDVTELIRTPEMDAAAAKVARLSKVRAALVSRQRALAAGGRVVMEGRDIGTSVFPDVDFAPIAEGFAFEAFTIRTMDDLEKAAPSIRSPEGPILLDCKINADIAGSFMSELAAFEGGEE